MKIFNPISITVTLGIHLLAGGFLLFTQGCQSTPVDKPDTATPPAIIPASQVGQKPLRSWDDGRLSEPTRPAWAVEPTATTELEVDTTVWNPDLGETTTTSLEQLTWSDPVRSSPAGESAQSSADGIAYTVAQGDTLSKIARNNGVSLRALLDANGLNINSVIRPGQELIIPTGGSADVAPDAADAVASSTTTTTATDSSGSYTVKAGDTLSRIANRHKVSVSALRSANNLTGDTIRIGQVLVIPDASESRTASTGATKPAAVAIADGSSIVHKVEAGEVLSVIARKYGTTVDQIKKDNNIRDERRVRVGQELTIRPRGAASGTVATPASAPAAAASSAAPAPVAPASTPSTAAPVATPAPAPVPAPVTPLEDEDRSILEDLMREGTANPIRE